jgi:hypothetical protein
MQSKVARFLGTNIPNREKIYLMATKYTKNRPASSITRPSKTYPNLGFWCENMTSGNSDAKTWSPIGISTFLRSTKY